MPANVIWGLKIKITIEIVIGGFSTIQNVKVHAGNTTLYCYAIVLSKIYQITCTTAELVKPVDVLKSEAIRYVLGLVD